MSSHDIIQPSRLDDGQQFDTPTVTSADTYEPGTLAPEHQAMLNELADLYRRNLISRDDFDKSADFLDKLHQS